MELQAYRLFEVQVLRFVIPELKQYNGLFAEHLINAELKTSGDGASGGYKLGARQTAADLLERPEPHFKLLKQLWHSIVGQIEQRPIIASNAWGVVMEADEFTTRNSIIQVPHEHLPWTVSGVYYVSIPKNMDAESEGGLIFTSPIPFQHKLKRRLPAVEGTLIAFPSYLLHAIEPFNCDGKRIGIALNAAIEPAG